jgi:hypothetical protein
MVLELKCSDGSKRYVRSYGNIILVTKDKKGALEELPEGWELVETKNGSWRPRKK